MRRLTSHEVFFPAAALYGAIVLPWSVLAIIGVVHGPAALGTPMGHAHELLLGYALAVVAGYQLPPMSGRRLALLFMLWLLARIAYVTGPGGLASAVPDIAFAAVLAWHVVPRLYVAAKKLRNLALPGLLAGLCVAAAAFDVTANLARPDGWLAIAIAVVLLLAALMLFMGGRIIAPAAAGQLQRQGIPPTARVQPRIEGALLALMAIAIAAAVVPALDPLLRAGCVAAGALALVRLLRWRLWECRGRPDLLCLGAGYAWLAIGLMALGLAPPGALRTAAIHLITVGAMGTLTFNVMANTVMTRARRDRTTEPRLPWGTALIAAAAVLRVAAVLAPEHALPLLMAAAACWSAAMLLLAALLAGLVSRRRASPA
jgi:uncharacterized protein involved in response to NO